jgi:hypothetical protein
MQLMHPIGSIYINATNSTNPGTLFGFGTWSSFGSGRVPVGFDPTNALFNTAEETGGIADAVVATHTHTASTTLSSTTHTHSGTTAGGGSHDHFIASNINSGGAAITSGTTAFRQKDDAGDSNYNMVGNTTAATVGLTNTVGTHTHTITTGNNSATPTAATTVDSAGVTGVNQNYQPYITVYMWKRTA